MIRTGRERRLRRKIHQLKAIASLGKMVEVQSTADFSGSFHKAIIPKPIPLKVVKPTFNEVDDDGKIKTVSAEKMRQSYQGGRVNLKELAAAGYPLKRD